MKRPNTVLILAAITVCLVVNVSMLGPSARVQATEDPGWGSPVEGVEMALSTTDSKTGTSPEVQVALRNVGDHDVTLNLGSMMANGKVQLPYSIMLTLTDPEGRTRIFRFADKKHSFVAGRLDDYVVPLRVGSMYTLRLTLDQFWCQETKEFEITLLPGRNQLTAQFQGSGAKLVNLDMPALKLMNFWLGKVESNTLVVERKP